MYARIPWELVADPLRYAKHTWGNHSPMGLRTEVVSKSQHPIALQLVLHFLRNPKIHYRIHKTIQLRDNHKWLQYGVSDYVNEESWNVTLTSHCANHKNYIPAMTSMRNISRRRSSRDSWRFEGNPQSITPPGLPPATAASWQVGHPLQQKDITSWFLKCNDYMVRNWEGCERNRS